MLKVPFEIIQYSDYDREAFEEAEIHQYRVFVGNSKPADIYKSEFIFWNEDSESLRRYIWEGFKLQPWGYEQDCQDYRNLPNCKHIANKLWNYRNIPKKEKGFPKYEVNEDMDNKLIILIENENYRSHGEVIVRSIAFLTSVFSDKAIADKHGFK